jgi:hypothetical protein
MSGNPLAYGDDPRRFIHMLLNEHMKEEYGYAALEPCHGPNEPFLEDGKDDDDLKSLG